MTTLNDRPVFINVNNPSVCNDLPFHIYAKIICLLKFIDLDSIIDIHEEAP